MEEIKNVKKVEDMNNIVEKQEKRIQRLQSNAFGLANLYFVFQGVILTAISGAPTSSITCSDHRRLLLALSSFAAAVNLFALFTIARVYTNALSQQHQNRLEHHDALTKLNGLRSQSRSQNQSQSQSQSQPEPAPPGNSSPSGNSSLPSRDGIKDAKVYFVFAVCILLFLGFAGVTIAGCWVIPCSRKDDCRRLSEMEEHCINLCEGSKCIRVCSQY